MGELFLNAVVCMALNVYHEGRGETLMGMQAIARVTNIRAEKMVRNVCAVVFEDSQFSWANQLTSHRPGSVARSRTAKRLMPNFKNAKDNDAWKRAMKIAQDEIEGKSKLKLIATHYCRIDAFCPWMDSMQAKGTIGDHRFAYDPKWKSRATPVLVASGT